MEAAATAVLSAAVEAGLKVLLLVGRLIVGGLRVDILNLGGIILDALFQGTHLHAQVAVELERAVDRLLEGLGAQGRRSREHDHGRECET
jgi:hypothetical protein